VRIRTAASKDLCWTWREITLFIATGASLRRRPCCWKLSSIGPSVRQEEDLTVSHKRSVCWELACSSPSREKDAKIVKALFPTTRSGATHADANGVIRFDLCLPGCQPADAPRVLWLDHALVHETSDSYQAGVLQHLQKKKSELSLPFTKLNVRKRGGLGV